MLALLILGGLVLALSSSRSRSPADCIADSTETFWRQMQATGWTTDQLAVVLGQMGFVQTAGALVACAGDTACLLAVLRQELQTLSPEALTDWAEDFEATAGAVGGAEAAQLKRAAACFRELAKNAGGAAFGYSSSARDRQIYGRRPAGPRLHERPYLPPTGGPQRPRPEPESLGTLAFWVDSGSTIPAGATALIITTVDQAAIPTAIVMPEGWLLLDVWVGTVPVLKTARQGRRVALEAARLWALSSFTVRVRNLGPPARFRARVAAREVLELASSAMPW